MRYSKSFFKGDFCLSGRHLRGWAIALEIISAFPEDVYISSSLWEELATSETLAIIFFVPCSATQAVMFGAFAAFPHLFCPFN